MTPTMDDPRALRYTILRHDVGNDAEVLATVDSPYGVRLLLNAWWADGQDLNDLTVADGVKHVRMDGWTWSHRPRT